MLMSEYLIDQYITPKAGEPYRLLPIGPIYKNGKKRNVTKDMVARFKLPHFKPPIKLGSHDDVTPAGGHIVGLEVREDGLYAVPEWVETGTQATESGAYRYHSPEIIWEGGYLEHPTTGEKIEGPLVVGDALLHTPHLGESVAFYSYQKGENTMSDEMVSVGLLEKLSALFTPKSPPVELAPAIDTPQPDDGGVDNLSTQVDEYRAKVDEYAAKIAKLEADAARRERVAHYSANIKDDELVNVLAELDEETADKLAQKFAALQKQADLALPPLGSAQSGEGAGTLHDAVLAYQSEHTADYNTAVRAVLKENPELATQWRTGKGV